MTHSITSWPNGARGALVLNVMYEQWAPGIAPGLGPMGNPLPPGVTDHQALSWADYGWRTGIWRVLESLDAAAVPASFYVSGILTESASSSVRAIVDGGHEICGHSWSQDRLPGALTRDEELAEIVRCVEELTRVGGQRPRGWISPRCTPSAHTAELLAAREFEWFGDVFDADLPYRLDTASGSIVALPFGLEINDLPMTVRYGQPTRELAASFASAAHALVRSGTVGYLDVTVHAHVGCRPAGIAALGEVIQTARSLGLWIATRGDVADRFVDSE
ncbi:polysaccharide deacetylase family protein [Marisediminicola senii]|uniref:polysaccharide deacetylase family protein n=1 Tax=Marisediminicola senii TaxID=2711233 RepID=UPI0013EAFF24|nr:polysaccharide deacetylase family protein [Marisediminicola senii]